MDCAEFACGGYEGETLAATERDDSGAEGADAGAKTPALADGSCGCGPQHSACCDPGRGPAGHGPTPAAANEAVKDGRRCALPSLWLLTPRNCPPCARREFSAAANWLCITEMPCRLRSSAEMSRPSKPMSTARGGRAAPGAGPRVPGRVSESARSTAWFSVGRVIMKPS